MEFLQNLGAWHWLVLAVVLAAVELVAPLVFFIWMALAALVVAIVLFIVPGIGWEAQFIAFAVLSVVSILLGRAWVANKPTVSQEPFLNKLDQQYIGRTVTLESPVVNGHGEIIINDTHWKIAGEDCPTGTKIKLTATTDGVFNYEIVV